MATVNNTSNKSSIALYDAKVVAYPVGAERDSYHVICVVEISSEDNTIVYSSYTATKNELSRTNRIELGRFDTYKEAIDHISGLIKEL